LQLLLPPNLALSAPRDAIMIRTVFTAPDGSQCAPEKARFGSGAGFIPEHQKPAAALKTICGGSWVGMAQLRRRALRELLPAFENSDCIAWMNAPEVPLTWKAGTIAGVHEHLADPAPQQKPSRPSEAATRSQQEPRRVVSAIPLVDGSRYFLSVQAEPGSGRPLSTDLTDFLKFHQFVWEPSNLRWWLRDERKVLNFLAAHLSTLRGTHGAAFTPNFERNLGNIGEVEVRVETREEGGDYVIETSIHADGIDPAALARAFAEGRDYVEAGGRLHLIPRARIEALEKARARLGGAAARQPSTRHRVRARDLVEAEEALEEALPGFRPPETWTARSAALRNLSRLREPPLPKDLDATLRLYQKIGVAWLLHLDHCELGGILADEMGLGKTLQALGFLACIRKAGEPPALIVAPAGLVDNWLREAAKFTPNLRFLRHHGEARATRPEVFAGVDAVVTSYSTLVRDEELLGGLEWRCVLADEAQHVKNRRTQAARSLASLRTRTRLLMTGTPIENSLDDLQALFGFLMPGFLKPVPAELRGEERTSWQRDILRRAAPFILRRTKTAVAPELPPRIEQVIRCRLEPSAAAAYASLRTRCEQELSKLEDSGAGDGAVRLAALTHLLRLRQFCCDPRLLPDGLCSKGLPSAKLDAFTELLDETIDGGHRMLVFSQFTTQLALLREHLENEGIRHLYLDGSTPNRAALCERFNQDPTIPVFLISLKAGGTGLNLTGADVVVHYDPWWNPAVEAQATDRAHRIGQRRLVTSYKIIVEDTVEEKVLDLQSTKRGLLEDLLEENQALATLTLGDLRDLLS
jgi:hypothetical protein